MKENTSTELAQEPSGVLGYSEEGMEELEEEVRAGRGSRGPRTGKQQEFAMAATPHNKEAADYLSRARAMLAIKQEEFAGLLEAELNRGLPEGGSPVGLKQSSVSNYEAGRRQVPAAVLFAAFKLTGLPIRDPEATRSMDQRLRRIEERLGLGTPGGTPLEVLPPEDDAPLQ